MSPVAADLASAESAPGSLALFADDPLPEPLPQAIVGELKEAIARDIRDVVEPVVRDRQGRVVRISSLWGRGAPFRAAMTHPMVLDPLECLLGPNIELILNRHNHATLRLADDGSSAYMHRDVLQWSRPIVTVIFYLEANGGTPTYGPGAGVVLDGGTGIDTLANPSTAVAYPTAFETFV